MSTVLNIKELTRTFGAKIAVDHISFTVKKGEILGLLGPNGAGKTTAIRMIMGILNPDSGQVEFMFNGKTTVLDKNRIGYLPEERGLYDDAKVLDTLVYLAVLKGVNRTKARQLALQWLDKFELAEYAGKKLEKLSKGMQQKVQFIATILHEPEVVMLDEPFSGLDPINQDIVKDFIRELQQKGTAILLSAHQMNLVEELCENIFMINQGKQILYGSLKEIKRQHGDHILKIRFPEQEDPSFIDNKAGISIIYQAPGRRHIRYTGTKTVNALLQELSSKLSLEEISVEKPPLHDIFVQTVLQRGEIIEDPGFK